MEISLEERKIFENVEKSILGYFDLSLDKIVERDTSNRTSMVRNMLYYILHYEKGLSSNKIALRYSRTPRVVKRQVSIIKTCLNNNKAYFNLYDKLLYEIKKGDN